MTETIRVRPPQDGDDAGLARLYPRAFPGEDLLPLVMRLHREVPGLVALVACAGEAVVGHVAFTPCFVGARSEGVALLGPLAVQPAWQGRGIGSNLVRRGLAALRAEDVAAVLVLGDPAYYGRFGFGAETRILPPYDLPPEWRDAWQSLGLRPVPAPLAGRLSLPPPWQAPALWAP
ncbi:MAG: N-acetyltransferase [Geminicoccaceae bacterium]|nr:MAG: N-acetyltransferase [Geminicoccaceae bacterium]